MFKVDVARRVRGVRLIHISTPSRISSQVRNAPAILDTIMARTCVAHAGRTRAEAPSVEAGATSRQRSGFRARASDVEAMSTAVLVLGAQRSTSRVAERNLRARAIRRRLDWRSRSGTEQGGGRGSGAPSRAARAANLAAEAMRSCCMILFVFVVRLAVQPISRSTIVVASSSTTASTQIPRRARFVHRRPLDGQEQREAGVRGEIAARAARRAPRSSSSR